MQFEMAHPSCPLCKRKLPANSPEHTLSTRLCEQCQTMVLTAFRGADSMVAASAAVVPQRCAPAQVQHDAPALDHTMVGTPALFEGNPTDAPAFEHESQSPIPFEAPDEVRFDFDKDEDPDDRIHTVEADSSVFSENGSSRHRGELSEGFVQSISTTDHDYAEADDSRLTGQPSAFTESAVDSAHTGASLVEDRSDDPPSIGEEAVTDPWEAPLPAWDYSHSEWPVLVGPSKRRSFRKLRSAIAAVVLLACATGFYFLIYRPSTPARRTATDSGATARVSAVEPRAATVRSADSDALAQAAPIPADTPAGAASRPAETVALEAVASNDNSAQGRFSLQAAAFPTQDGADEFAQKLKRAGVPSYVVPADVARRGRWFRVRVGRFNSAEEAQRFAGEAQQRARAAGLGVQLIVCQYDLP
jgi:cell division septation protein DedD